MKEEHDRGLPIEQLCRCPFCRTALEHDALKRKDMMENLAERGNQYAIEDLARQYQFGEAGYPKDIPKAIELFIQSGELGCASAYTRLGDIYFFGTGETINTELAIHYYELAAKMSDVTARYNLGCIEKNDGNEERAYKHFAMAAHAGHENALNYMKTGFKEGQVTNDEHGKALDEYQKSQDEMKSDIRAAALERKRQISNDV